MDSKWDCGGESERKREKPRRTADWRPAEPEKSEVGKRLVLGFEDGLCTKIH